jgi:hypothetical protein
MYATEVAKPCSKLTGMHIYADMLLSTVHMQGFAHAWMQFCNIYLLIHACIQ